MGFLSTLRWMGRISRPWIAKSIPLNGYTMCLSFLWALSETCTHDSFHDFLYFLKQSRQQLQVELSTNSALCHPLFQFQSEFLPLRGQKEIKKIATWFAFQASLMLRSSVCCKQSHIHVLPLTFQKSLLVFPGRVGRQRGCQFPFSSFCSHLSPQGKLWLTVHALTA